MVLISGDWKTLNITLYDKINHSISIGFSFSFFFHRWQTNGYVGISSTNGPEKKTKRIIKKQNFPQYSITILCKLNGWKQEEIKTKNNFCVWSSIGSQSNFPSPWERRVSYNHNADNSIDIECGIKCLLFNNPNNNKKKCFYFLNNATHNFSSETTTRMVWKMLQHWQIHLSTFKYNLAGAS